MSLEVKPARHDNNYCTCLLLIIVYLYACVYILASDSDSYVWGTSLVGGSVGKMIITGDHLISTHTHTHP